MKQSISKFLMIGALVGSLTLAYAANSNREFTAHSTKAAHSQNSPIKSAQLPEPDAIAAFATAFVSLTNFTRRHLRK